MTLHILDPISRTKTEPMLDGGAQEPGSKIWWRLRLQEHLRAPSSLNYQIDTIHSSNDFLRLVFKKTLASVERIQIFFGNAPLLQLASAPFIDLTFKYLLWREELTLPKSLFCQAINRRFAQRMLESDDSNRAFLTVTAKQKQSNGRFGKDIFRQT